ncbi:MAG TPA: glycine--tRNA ligase [Candidatus Acidoferrales bacterium]|jgi:glycyl-tRNA synthetase|nr:glycine--tRNA ligase [Candidatus Acidoferrales bacterium]
MAEPKENLQMEKIVSLCKRRGFIFQSSEIYGGINGFWDYGPLGAELKRNVKELWWNTMTREREDVAGLEATIIMSPAIWKASGHVDTFSDPMCSCKACKKLIREDQWWTMMCEQSWVQSLAAIVEAGTNQLSGEDLLKWAKTKGKSLAPNLALVRNPEVTLSWLAEDVEKGKRPADAKEYFQYLATEQRGATGFVKPCPHCGGELTEPRPFNLMFKSHYGPVESDENVCYLRPETAQAIFVQFKNVLETSRQKVPFGIGQIGKAFRNEITPRNYTFRSREFEQMELEFFIKPDEAVEAIHGSVATVPATGHPGEPQPNWGWQTWHQYWVEERVRFYEGIGLSRDTLGFHHQTPDELAHYARACTDILFKFPFSKKDEQGNVKGDELEGIAARSDFDLSQHQRFSGKPMGVFDEELRAAWGKLPKEKQDDLWKRYYDHRKNYMTKSGVEAEAAQKQATEDANGLAKGQYVPHVIEPSAGVDRLILALIANAYTEVTKTDDKGKTDTTYVMKFHPRVAPIKVGILPLLKNKPELVKKALEVRDLLRPWMNVYYDDGGSIGKRYARQDEAGTPFCLTIDFDTLGEKPELLDTVTIRYRDDGKQERLKISELRDFLLSKTR